MNSLIALLLSLLSQLGAIAPVDCNSDQRSEACTTSAPPPASAVESSDDSRSEWRLGASDRIYNGI